MQCVFDNGGISPWIGCRPKEACMRWLVSPGRIVAVEAGFDVCRVSLPAHCPLPYAFPPTTGHALGEMLGVQNG